LQKSHHNYIFKKNFLPYIIGNFRKFQTRPNRPLQRCAAYHTEPKNRTLTKIMNVTTKNNTRVVIKVGRTLLRQRTAKATSTCCSSLIFSKTNASPMNSPEVVTPSLYFYKISSNYLNYPFGSYWQTRTVGAEVATKSLQSCSSAALASACCCGISEPCRPVSLITSTVLMGHPSCDN